MEKQQYIGVWITRDGSIRHEFLPNGRYYETRDNTKSSYTGYYSVLGNHVEYLDDSGFTADGDFRNGVFYHAGMVLYKDKDGNDNPLTETQNENKKLAH